MSVVNILMTNRAVEGFEPFTHDGCEFVFVALGPDGPRRLIEGPIWAFVDWVMDDLAGLEMCRRLRADPRTSEAHVTLILDEDDAEDRRRALKAGADDYMVGPVGRTEVLDRVLALQSGQSGHSVGSRFVQGDLVIDMPALRACWAGAPIDLRPNEFRLLRFLAENPNRVLSREDLIAGLGKSEVSIDERTVDVWIGRLRRAIRDAGGGNPLRTIRSMGYVFDLP
ncbi:response regulator transcription factor [Erythrobacter sp. HKB08]|uniref:response regulator transcription factor n=1 Tax=Erythrobacter sp. HKB08 TaxID=2502843 RepID=UPI0010087FAA|nr:response regulator transcription factor [Erythrobacter sp. HKB08]